MGFDATRKTEPQKILSNVGKFVEEKLADKKPEEASTQHRVEETNISDPKSVQGRMPGQDVRNTFEEKLVRGFPRKKGSYYKTW